MCFASLPALMAESAGPVDPLDHLLFGRIRAHDDDVRVVPAVDQAALGHLLVDRLNERADEPVAEASSGGAIDVLQADDVEHGDRAEPVVVGADRVVELLAEGDDVLEPGERIDLPVHGGDLPLGKAVEVLAAVLLLGHAHDEYVVVAAPLAVIDDVSEVLDVADLPLLGDDPVSQVVVAVTAFHRLGVDGVLGLPAVVRMDHVGKAVADVLEEFVIAVAPEQMHDVAVGVQDVLLALGAVDEKTAGKAFRNLIFKAALAAHPDTLRFTECFWRLARLEPDRVPPGRFLASGLVSRSNNPS